MRITTVLFDLDGTLLPMDQIVFVKAYLTGISSKAAPYGYEPKKLVDTIWAGTAAMMKNPGTTTNKDAFWSEFAKAFGAEALSDAPIFDAYYLNEFQQVQDVCGFQPQAAALIQWLKAHGIRVILATNPIFPRVATESRVRWAGLQPGDFEYITTYENSCHCKPNPAYYRDILDRIQAKPEECLMVGNDATEDMVAGDLGMKVFLVTDCLIAREDTDISRFLNGDFAAMAAYVREAVERG